MVVQAGLCHIWSQTLKTGFLMTRLIYYNPILKDYAISQLSRDMTKPTVTVRLAKTQISLGIRPVWSESSLCTQWVAKDPSYLHADNEDVDQTGRMPRLVWVFAGHTLILLVLSCRGSIFLKFAPIWYGCRNTFNSKKKKKKKKQQKKQKKKQRVYPFLIWLFWTY